jgi:integrase/recombinase XerD
MKTIDQMVLDFLVNQDVKNNSIVTYRNVLRSFFGYLSTFKIDFKNITRADVIVYKKHIAKDKSITTQCYYLTIVRKFFKYCESNGYCSNVADGIKLPARYKGFQKTPLTLDQAKMLLDSIPVDNIKGLRDYVILTLLVHRGLRIIEIARMNISDIEKYRGRWIIRIQRKARDSKDDFTEVSDFYPLIERYLSYRGDFGLDEPLFVNLGNRLKDSRMTERNIGYIVKKYLRGCGIDDAKITAHSMRHTAAVLLIDAGYDIVQVQNLLGHSDPKITMLYTRYAEENIKLANKTGNYLDGILKKPIQSE